MLLLDVARPTCSSRASASGASTSRSAGRFDIINFVWWIGIGHAGTLISAILLLLRQKWRTSINRFAEAMTLFAVACAGIFPLLHTRPAVARLLAVPVSEHDGAVAAVPQPADLGRVRGLDLRHGVAAVLVRRPDPRPGDAARPLAVARSARSIYGMLAMGWRGSARHWHRYETAYLLLAGLATPLVVSVHTVVSFDFAVGDRARLAHDDLPALLRRRRHLLRLRDGADAGDPDRARSTAWRTSSPCATCENMAKVMLATGLIVAYGYVHEAFIAWYSGNTYERFMMHEPRCSARTRWAYWSLILCNVVIPQLLLVQAACARNVAGAVRHLASSSTSACGSSASSSSSPACTATSCRRRGACITRRSGTGRRSSARSACS